VIVVLSPSPALDVTYLVDSTEPGVIHRPNRVMRQAGGKGLNVARAAAVLGERIRVVAPLGGHVGALITQLAADEGLALDPVPIAAEARSCVSAVPNDGAPTEYYEPVPALTAVESHLLAEQFASLPAAGWSALAGSLPDAPVDGALLVRRSAGDRLAIDSSGFRLGALLDAVAPELLKVNASEAAELLGRGGRADALAAALRDRTGGSVVVTDGAAGAAAVDATGAWRATPDSQPGRFAIGSGDSFFAGLLVALAAGASLPDALHSASAAGSANTRAPGAGVFTRADYAAALTRIEVHPA
jgi:1-phosphofructokinase family hexose kinase